MNKIPPTLQPLGLSYIYGGFIHYRPGEKLPSRNLSDFELVLILEGHVQYVFNGRSYPCPPGTAILAQPEGQEHYLWDPDSLTRHSYVHFNATRFPDDWPERSQWPRVVTTPPSVLGPMFRYLLERLSDHPEWLATHPGPTETNLFESILRLLLFPGQEITTPSQRFPQPVHQALNLMRRVIENDPHQTLLLEHVARQAGVTEKHLCRLFAQAIGHPPMKTLRLMKLQVGVALLARSDLAIHQIADRCGFENPLYFSRCMTDCYGQSPTTIRTNIRNGQPPPPSPLPSEIYPRVYW